MNSAVAVEVEGGFLCNLPTELLLVIFRELHWSDLHSVIYTAHRLFNIGLPAYLSARQIDISPTGTILISAFAGTLDLLPVLGKATFITSLAHLSFGFSYPDDNLLLQIQDVRLVLERMAHLDHFTLSLFTKSTESNWHLKKTSTKEEIRQQIVLRNNLVAMLDTATRVSSTVTVHHGEYPHLIIGGKPQFLTMSSIRIGSDKLAGKRCRQNTTGHTTRNLLWPLKLWWRKLGVLHQVKDIRLPKNLHTFQILSQLLVTQPFVHWTIDIMNTCNITYLHIGACILSPHEWEIFLFALHIPTLEHFKFRPVNASLYFFTLTGFVGRHLRLATLDLASIQVPSFHIVADDSASIQNFPISLVGISLSSVKTIFAEPQTLSNLLSIDGLFPELQTAYITWTPGDGNRVGVTYFETSISPLRQGLLSVALGLRVCHQSTDLMAEGDHWTSPLKSRITMFSIEMVHPFEPRNIAGLRGCIEMFPNLTHFTIDDCMARISRNVESDRPDIKKLIAKTLCENYPGLMQLEIYGELDTCENWKARVSEEDR